MTAAIRHVAVWLLPVTVLGCTAQPQASPTASTLPQASAQVTASPVSTSSPSGLPTASPPGPTLLTPTPTASPLATATATALVTPAPTTHVSPTPTPAPQGLELTWRPVPGDLGFGELTDPDFRPLFRSGAVFADRMFIVGDRPTENYDDTGSLWSSEDGTTWQLVELPEIGFSRVETVATTPASIVVVSRGGERLWVSGDGLNWDTVVDADLGDVGVGYLAATSQGFLGLGQAAWSSLDGREWTVVESDSLGALREQGVYALGSGADQLVAISQLPGGGFETWHSTNLIDWQVGGRLPGSRNSDISGVYSGPLGWIVTGNDRGDRENTDAMWRSTDGISWEKLAQQVGPVSDVFVDELGFVAVGFIQTGSGCALDPADIQGLTWTSVDGLTWTLMPLEDFNRQRIDHLLLVGRTLYGVGASYANPDRLLEAAVWTATLPELPPAGPGPIRPTPETPTDGCGPR